MEKHNPDSLTNKSSRIVGDSYFPPQIEVINIALERGFANSTEDFGEPTW